MKTKALILLLTLVLFSCNKDDDNSPSNPIEQLPPATQVGANKVGCLLDGQAFLPGNIPNATNCFYQLVDGEYYFALAFTKRDLNNNLIGLDIGTNSKEIFQGETYPLLEYVPNNAAAAYIYNIGENFTNSIHTGELIISKLDFTENIVSGTFWFDVQDSSGVVHQIREGRFDMRFTQ